MPKTKTKAPASKPLTASVAPNAVRDLPLLPLDDHMRDAVEALAVACNGMLYQGADLDAQLRAVKFLRSRPDLAVALGIGGPQANA